LKNHACSRPWPYSGRPRYADPAPPYSSLAACIKYFRY